MYVFSAWWNVSDETDRDGEKNSKEDEEKSKAHARKWKLRDELRSKTYARHLRNFDLPKLHALAVRALGAAVIEVELKPHQTADDVTFLRQLVQMTTEKMIDAKAVGADLKKHRKPMPPDHGKPKSDKGPGSQGES